MKTRYPLSLLKEDPDTFKFADWRANISQKHAGINRFTLQIMAALLLLFGIVILFSQIAEGCTIIFIAAVVGFIGGAIR